MVREAQRGVKAIEVAGRMLEVLARTQTPVALRELAAASHMSPGKVHRYLASFVASGLARQDHDSKRYALGPLAMRCVGRPAAARGNLRYGILPTTRRTLPLSLWPPRLRLVTTWAGHPARKLHV